MSDLRASHADQIVSLLADGRTDPRALYYLWEQQQWEAGKIDLAPDAGEWPGLDAQTRRAVADSIAWRRMRAEAATTVLVFFVDLAPEEEQQVFLTTQLVDEARHLVFFDRVYAEVAGGVGETIEERQGLVDDPAIRSLLVEVLPEPAAGLRGAGAGPAELVSAVCAYHLGIVGALGLTELGALLEHLETEDVLPGIRRGLGFEERAAQRHVAFGVELLAQAIGKRPSLRSVAAGSVERWLPLVRSALGSIAMVAPAVYASEPLADGAMLSLEGWFAEAGLEVRVS